MKFIETKREELRRERIALNEQEWPELRDLLLGAGQRLFDSEWGEKQNGDSLITYMNVWESNSAVPPTITLAELKAKYFEPETREPKVGDWGYFWQDHSEECATFARLERVDSDFYHSPILSYKHFSHTIPPHIQELMKEPEYEVVHYFGESDGQIVVEKEIGPGLYAGTRGGVNVVLKRITP